MGGGLIRLSGEIYILTGLTSVLFLFCWLLNFSSSVGLGGLESENMLNNLLFEESLHRIIHRKIVVL